MERPRIKLDCIRVQTARMMEIYALLQGEIEKNADLGLTAQTRAQLDHAIATIHANMRNDSQDHILRCNTFRQRSIYAYLHRSRLSLYKTLCCQYLLYLSRSNS